MPIYLFRCSDCSAETELLLPLGELHPRPCAECGGDSRHRLSRVGVKYGAWGFTSTDKLVTDTRGKDFKALRSKAEQISDG